MSAAVAAILGVAGNLAVPYIKKILTSTFGAGGKLAGDVVDQVARHLGVSADEIPSVPEAEVADALVQVEPYAAEIWAAMVQSQALTLDSIKLDYAKEPWWAWAWRPAWMWILAAVWIYALIIQPIVKAVWVPDLAFIDMSILMALTGLMMTLYMGGHTVKSVFKKG